MTPLAGVAWAKLIGATQLGRGLGELSRAPISVAELSSKACVSRCEAGGVRQFDHRVRLLILLQKQPPELEVRLGQIGRYRQGCLEVLLGFHGMAQPK